MTLSATDDAPWPSPARGWTVVALLFVAYIVSFVDRTILSLLIEPIKADLALDDVQIGLLSGFAFGLFYSVMGLPLGWLADRRSRRVILAVAIAVWSLATVACGFANSFGALFAARVFVGIGEAALAPAALSLISDLFAPARRALAVSVFVSAGSIGGGLAFILGGALVAWAAVLATLGGPLIGSHAPWQMVFIIVGAAGLPLAAAFLLISEPARRGPAAVPGGGNIFSFIAANAWSVVPLIVAMTALAVVAYGTLTWVPSHFIRTHGWTAPEVGLSFGAVFFVFGALGSISGGALSSRLRPRLGSRANLTVVSLGLALLVLPATLAPLAGNATTSLAVYAAVMFLFAFPSGAAAAHLQDIAPPNLRGQLSAVYYIVMNLVGLSVGSLLVALVAKSVFNDALGPAMSLIGGSGGTVAVGAAVTALLARKRTGLSS